MRSASAAPLKSMRPQCHSDCTTKPDHTLQDCLGQSTGQLQVAGVVTAAIHTHTHLHPPLLGSKLAARLPRGQHTNADHDNANAMSHKHAAVRALPDKAQHVLPSASKVSYNRSHTLRLQVPRRQLSRGRALNPHRYSAPNATAVHTEGVHRLLRSSHTLL